MPSNALYRGYKKADEYVTNALIGAGYGIQNQLEGLYQMAAHPVNMLRGIGAMVANPREAGNAIWQGVKDYGTMATSGPLGLGQVIGENMPLTMRRAPSKLDIISPETAKGLRYSGALPATEEFAAAVANTPGAQITPDGLLMKVARKQGAHVEGEQAIRTGVFYLPAGDKRLKYYGGKSGYGGDMKFEGDTLYKNPLFVKGATGGKAPENAYDMIAGKGAYESMRRDVLGATVEYNKTHQQKVDALRPILEKYGGDPTMASVIVGASNGGNTLPYAVQEHIVAHAVRNAGYDSVLGYSKGQSGPFLSEVFDVREQTYPSDVLSPQIHDKFGGGQ